MHVQYEEMPNNPLLPSMTMVNIFNDITIETIFQTDNFPSKHDSTLNLTDNFQIRTTNSE